MAHNMTTINTRRPAYRDGIELRTEGEIFTAPGGEIVEILYDSRGRKSYFVELPGAVACAHGDSVVEAILEAREKLGISEPLSNAEKLEYRAENFRFSVSLFKRLTKACRSGIKTWLDERGLDADVTMTIRQLKDAGGGKWADALERSLQ